MEANDYQRLSGRTLIDKPDAEYSTHELMLVWNAMGLAGEAGEVVDILKKAVFHRHGLDEDKRQKLLAELGDVLWYIAALATKLDASLSEIMEMNIAKLAKRYGAEGYTSAQSIARVDVENQ